MLVIRLCLIAVFFSGLLGCTSTKDKPTPQDPGVRTFSTFMGDEKLEVAIATNLRKTGPGLGNAHINVFCFNGVVLLTGEVPTNTLKNLAGETTRDNNKVRQVHNELKIQSNSTFFSRTNDNWIASKVRSKILMQKIESERVKVVVENRVVYLMGLLTREEAQSISELSASIKGVERVVRVFEYIQRI